jgi:8-oxo-dGTP pyrophosphatase MutT (NUDIX family)
MAIAPIRPASTVVVLRGGAERAAVEVLMVRRINTAVFMGGAFVFPGGRVDDQDVAAAQAAQSGAADQQGGFRDLTPREELAYRLAAVRELHEEAGVGVQPDALVPLAHWVTPEVETRRFDTRFFLATMPPDQEARHDASETTELAWMTPADAIARSRRRDIMLPPPTWTTLKRLLPFTTLDEVFAWAEQTPIVRIQPRFLQDAGRTMLTLPGDPSYPSIEGWDVPEDTRFLLQDGGWQPVPP